MQQGDTVELDLPATHKYLNVLGACITEMLARVDGLPEAQVVAYNTQLAVHEICTNIVDHAYGGKGQGRIHVLLTLSASPRRLLVEIRDQGRPFDPGAVPDPNLDEGQIHGYGLFLVRELMDDVRYDTNPTGNRWRLMKNL